MVTTPLDMKYIYKRERSLEKAKSITESSSIPNLSEITNRDLYRYKVESFMNNCSSYKKALSLLEVLYDTDKFDLLEASTQVMINNIIPTVEASILPECIIDIGNSNIGNINRDRLIESAKVYKSVDRIRKNHKNLSKRFELESFNGKSDREKCYKICEMVDTYDLTRFIKFNIALEEISYLGYIEGNRISENEMVEYVSDYFLMIKENTKEDIDSYKRAIMSSKVLSEHADSNIKYIIEGYKKKSNYWVNKLNEWKLDPDKEIDTLVELARENYSDITVLNKILDTINEFVSINGLEFNTIDIFKEFTSIDSLEAQNIMNIIRENNISNTDELVSNLRCIWEAELSDEMYDDGTTTPETFTSDKIDKFKMHNLIVDAQSVGEFLDKLEKTSMKESPIKITKTDEYMDPNRISESNLISYVDNNDYISMRLRSYIHEGHIDDVYNFLKSSIKCINNILYNRDSIAYYTIGENTFDISIRSKYKLILSESQDNTKFFSESDKKILCDIEKYTQIAESIANSKLPAIVDKLTSDRFYAANVNPQEAALICDILAPYNSQENNFIESFLDLCKEEANPKYDRIVSECMYIPEEELNLEEDHITRIEFCANILGLSEGAIDNVKSAFEDLGNVFKKKEKKSENFKPDNSIKPNKDDISSLKKNTIKQQPSSIKSNKKSVDDEDDDSEISNDNSDNKPTKEKDINSINDLKLAWSGVKSKLKKASTKEQEISRDLDMEFNHLLKNIQNTYGRDYRSEIITGEVNRSLSKAIKIGITLAGIGGIAGKVTGAGILAGSAIAPIIGAVVSFAKSKFTSNKEKKMILDEIDIELKVLDREISRAESSGSTKKYRQLLTIQRNLQRKRQEIYYNLTKKGKRIPMGPTAGMAERE